jgi:hypothetical protein
MNRSRFFSILVAIVFLFPNYVSADKAPRQIAGLVLGEQIAMFVDLVRMETATPLRDRKYLREVRTRETDGYRSGTVSFIPIFGQKILQRTFSSIQKEIWRTG